MRGLKNNPIDWQDVLKITNNKPELAKEMIAMLGAELPQTKKNINAAFNQNNYDDLLTYIHKLHGSCCYCGVKNLREISARLETKLKKHHHQGLDQEINKINQEIDSVLNFMTKHEII